MLKQDIKIAADSVVLWRPDEHYRILLVKRGSEPFKGMWALPGGFVEDDEELDVAARRELLEETGVKLTKMEQLRTFGTLGRDPRFRTVSVVFYALIDPNKQKIRSGDDAADVQWFDTAKLPKLAFDHGKIVKFALQRLKI